MKKTLFSIFLLCLCALPLQSCSKITNNEEQLYKSKHLAMFDLKGNVKSCSMDIVDPYFICAEILNFDHNGNLNLTGEIGDTYNFEESGGTLSLSGEDLNKDYIFGKDGSLTAIKERSSLGNTITEIIHSDKQITMYYSHTDNAGKTTESTKKYIIDSVDDHGNWISLKEEASDLIIEREIYYYEAEEEEVVSASEFTTPDITLFGLKGHVKSVTMTSPEFTQSYFSPKSLKYDEQGMLRSYDDSEEYVRFIFSEDNKTAVRQSDVINGTTRVKKAVSKNYDLVRDSQGRLIKMAPHMQDDEYNMGEYNIVWNSQGFVTEILLSTDGGDPNMTVSYDSNNMPSKIVMSGYTTHEYTITYSEFDSHGNWLRRNVEYYYEAVYDGEEDIHRSFQETRTITYFE